MRRKIFLVRHGESADKQQGQSDFDRVLTSKGKNSVELLGKFFMKEKLKVSSMISSTAKRAQETSQILAREIELPLDLIVFDDSLYNGIDDAYIEVINVATSSLLIVGHNPAISNVIGKITTDYSIALLPGQCALIEIENQQTQGYKHSVQLIGPFH